MCANSPQRIYAQASVQRKVNISNTNGNLLSLQTAIGVQPYTLTFPVSVNPSGSTASILYGLGSGNLAWTSSSSASNGWVLTLNSSGGNLIPSWVDPLTLNFWQLGGNSGTTAYNGTTGNFIGTTNTQPVVIATTNTTTPQPIEFYTGNSETMRLTGSGDLGIGITNPSQLLQVNNGNIFLSNAGSAGQIQLQGTGTGISTFQAGAQGATNINYTLPISAPSIGGQVLSATMTGTMSWASVGSVTSVGLSLPGSLFSVSGSPVTLSGTLTGTLLTQPSNTVFAGPMSGGATAPTFRMLVATDIPALNYVTSVGLSLPASLFNVSGSPITSSGTLTGSLATQAANMIFAGPSSGVNATPTFRTMVTADIPNNIVTYAKIQNETNNTVLGNVSGVSAAPSELTAAQLKTLLNLTGTNSGDVTLAGQNYLSLSGQQITANPIDLTGTNITGLLKAASFPILTGDVTTIGGSLATTISNGAVTLPKMASFPALSIMGNPTASATTPSAITLGAGLSFSGTTLVGTGGTVTSVGLSLPASVFSVTGSPVTSSGTLTGSFTTQSANIIFAGPSSGVASAPTFRSLVAADIPALNYVTSVGLSLPASLFSVSGSPVTSSGTLTGSLATQNANLIFAGPSSGGAAAPTFRALAASDIPALTGYILNQTTQQASSNFNISGQGQATSFTGTDNAAGAGSALTVRGGTSTGTSAGAGVAISGTNGSTTGAGGAISVTGGNGAGNAAGGNITLTSGNAGATGGAAGNFSATAGNAGASGISGGTISLTAGQGGATSNGGTVTITAGLGGSTSGIGGALTIAGGATPAGSSSGGGNVTVNGGDPNSGAGGVLTLRAGNSTGANPGNPAYLYGGLAGTSGNGGTAQVQGGAATSGSGGVVNIFGGNSASGAGGSIALTTGTSGGTANGGAVTITMTSGITTGNGGSFTVTNGNGAGTGSGGNVSLTAGNSGGTAGANAGIASLIAGNGITNNAGGAVNITAGNGVGTNQFGGGVAISGGNASGTGSSSVTFLTAKAGVTGSTTNTAATHLTLDGSGNLTLNASSAQIVLTGTSTGVTTFQAGAQGAANINYTLPTSAPTVSGQVLSSTLGGSLSWVTPGSSSVTSVGLQMPAVLYSSVTNSPITTSGTLIPVLATQTANTIFAGPSSGGAATPTFRALVPADLNTAAWGLSGNSIASAYNGTTGSFLGTTNTQPLILATTNTTTSQPIDFYTNNTARMRLNASGFLSIGGTFVPSSPVHVKFANAGHSVLYLQNTDATGNANPETLTGTALLAPVFVLTVIGFLNRYVVLELVPLLEPLEGAIQLNVPPVLLERTYPLEAGAANLFISPFASA